MRSPYKPAEIKAAMTLKGLSAIGLAQQLNVSKRTLGYFIHGDMNMSRGEELLQILEPELTEIVKIEKRIKRRKLQQCEVK